MKGILDTTSLDLNVSREMVQNSPVIRKISKSVTKRVLSELKKKLKKDEAGYDTFWEQFGKVWTCPDLVPVSFERYSQ